MSHTQFIRIFLAGFALAVISQQTYAAATCMELFEGSQVTPIKEHIERLETLLQQTPLSSPFRPKIALQLQEAQLMLAEHSKETVPGETQRQAYNQKLTDKVEATAALKIKQKESNADVFKLLEQTEAIPVPGGATLEMKLAQMNNLPNILSAVKTVRDQSPTEDTRRVQKAALFELANRLQPFHRRNAELDEPTVDELAQITYYAVTDIFGPHERPQGAPLPAFNPFRYFDQPLLNGKLKLTASAETKLVAAFIAGTKTEHLLTYETYYAEFLRMYISTRSSLFGFKKIPTIYDEEIRSKVQELSKSSAVYRALAKKL